MSQPAHTMGPAEREVVRDAIIELCQAKHWCLLAVHVRSNHVHIVVALNRDPGRVKSDIKAAASGD